MERELRILFLEDTLSDAELMQYELKKSGITFMADRVETRDDFLQALEEYKPDLVLSDYNLPGFNGREALQIVRKTHPEIPVIMVTGTLGDEAAVQLVHEGAKDYVLKDNLVRLGPAVEHALATEQGIRARKAAELALHITLDRIERQLEAVGRVAMSAALISGQFEQFASEISELAANTTGAERITIWLFNEEETELRCVDLYEATPNKHSAEGVVLRAQFGNEIQAVIREKYVNADDPLTDPRTAGYVENYIKPLRISSMLDTLIHVSGRNLGMLCFAHVDKPHHWEQDEITFATQLAEMLALALVNWQRMQMQEQLRQNLVDTIRAFALTVEKRDPYTAGHQQRVAELCVAIGRDMGLPESRLEGLRLGASIQVVEMPPGPPGLQEVFPCRSRKERRRPPSRSRTRTASRCRSGISGAAT